MGTPFLVRIDPGDGLPIYRQIVEQVKAALAAGALKPGDRLPSHRDLAKDLVVAPLTVSRAYEVLEEEGLLATERGRGTFVAEVGPGGTGPTPPAAEEALKSKAEALVRQARALGLNRREAIKALGDAWEEENRDG
jgi:GntR family transcriptional regulator